MKIELIDGLAYFICRQNKGIESFIIFLLGFLREKLEEKLKIINRQPLSSR